MLEIIFHVLAVQHQLNLLLTLCVQFVLLTKGRRNVFGWGWGWGGGGGGGGVLAIVKSCTITAISLLSLHHFLGKGFATSFC